MPTNSPITLPAHLAAHLAIIDNLLPAGSESCLLTRTGVAELRAAIAAAVEGAMAATVAGTTPPAVDQAAPDVEIAPDLLRDMQKIARSYRGLAYDPHDRPEEVAAVVAAARAAGLTPVPDESLIRAYRGCVPPAPADQQPATLVVDPSLAELAMEAEQYAWPAVLPQHIPHQGAAVDEVLAVLATQARPLLEGLYTAGRQRGVTDALVSGTHRTEEQR